MAMGSETMSMSPTVASKRGEKRSVRCWKTLGRILLHLFLIALSLLFLFPFYYMTIQSVMTQRELFSIRPVWFPNQFRYQNFVELFHVVPFARIAANSLFIAVSSTVGSLFFSSLAGFTFAKYRFPGKQVLFWVMLSTMMMPGQVTLIPRYLLMVKVLHWQNTYLSVIVPRLVPTFGIFLMRQYASTALHDELMDAATIDGCGFFGIYWRLALPLMLPALAVLGLLSFVWAWNDFLWPLLMLTKVSMQTIPVNLNGLKDSTGTAESLWSVLMAGTALGTFPLVLLFLFGQRFFVAGLMAGAFKGV